MTKTWAMRRRSSTWGSERPGLSKNELKRRSRRERMQMLEMTARLCLVLPRKMMEASRIVNLDSSKRQLFLNLKRRSWISIDLRKNLKRWPRISTRLLTKILTLKNKIKKQSWKFFTKGSLFRQHLGKASRRKRTSWDLWSEEQNKICAIEHWTTIN